MCRRGSPPGVAVKQPLAQQIVSHCVRLARHPPPFGASTHQNPPSYGAHIHSQSPDFGALLSAAGQALKSAALDYSQIINALDAEIVAFAETVRRADPAAAVATCPPWDVGELVKHTGYSHRWAGEMVRRRVDKVLPFRDVAMGLPADRKEYPDWLAAGREPLVATLRAADPDAAMWAWGADRHVRFWARRQLFETAIHHADAEMALGRQPAVEAATAVEGIDEFLENLPHAAHFAPHVKELRGNGESLHFHCTDAEGEWMIQLEPDGFSWEHGHGKGSVAVRGAAADLLLLTYGRLKADDARFQRFGDEGVLASWLVNARI